MKELAWWISLVGHPFSMVALLVLVPALRRSSGHALRSVLLVAVAIILPLALLMFRQVRRGHWSNVDASNPSERPVLFVVALLCLAAAIGWLKLHDPQSFLVRGMIVTGAFLLLASLLTRWVKLSLHVAFATLTATTLSLMGSWVGYALIPVVPLICWSRLALARHQVHELVIGLFLGGLTGVALVAL